MINDVRLSRSVRKDLKILPKYILIKLQAWIDMVSELGIENTRHIKGFNDEALRGKRLGQRSIRLSKSYRCIYEVKKEKIVYILLLEVNKHEY
jgi:proteic killer suppression protein